MCGLVGIAGNIGVKEDKVFKTLLILDALRGVDSTGVAAVTRHADVNVVKQLGNPYELFETRGYSPAMNKMNRAIIGHNRYATTGDVIRKNAHPFDMGEIVGVHNGTLRNKWQLLDSKDFKVDSENALWHIQEKGLKDFLNVVDGAYAFIWWDRRDETLNFLRNKERPLWMVKTLDQSTLFWASEKWMIEVAAAREDLKLGEYHWAMEDMHYSINISDKGVMEKPVVAPAPTTYIPYVHHGGYQQHQKKTTTLALVTPANTTVQTQTSNPTTTVSEKKRNLQSSVASKKGYVSSKCVTLELMAVKQDINGATYVACYDPLESHISIRMYVKKGDEMLNKVGKFITANIKDIRITPKDGTYYKIDRNSVKELEIMYIDTRKLVDAIEEEADVDLKDVEVLNHRGKYITQAQFLSDYGCCGACDGYVNPQFKYRFLAGSGEAICHECLENKEVVNYLPALA